MSYPKGEVTTIVQQYLKAGDVAIDVGACRGEILRCMTPLVGREGLIIAVEPDQRSLGVLADTYPEVQRVPAAAWSSSGEQTLYRNAQGDQSSLFHELVRDWTEKAVVRTITLDEVAQGKSIALVKIDAQGAEPEILRGATQLLKQCPVWVLEVWPQGLTQAKSSPTALFDQIVDAGLTPCWADGAVVQRAEIADWSDKPTFANWICTR